MVKGGYGIGEKLLRQQGWSEEKKIVGTTGIGLEKPIEVLEMSGEGLGYDKSSSMKYTSSKDWTATHIQPFHEVLARANGKKSPKTERQKKLPRDSPQLAPLPEPVSKVSAQKTDTAESSSSEDDVPLVFEAGNNSNNKKKSPMLGSRRVTYTRRIKMRTEASKCEKSLGEILGTAGQRSAAKRERE